MQYTKDLLRKLLRVYKLNLTFNNKEDINLIMVKAIRYITWICAFISASTLALAADIQEPQIVKLETTWISIMLFVMILVFIIWALLKMKKKKSMQKTQH